MTLSNNGIRDAGSTADIFDCPRHALAHTFWRNMKMWMWNFPVNTWNFLGIPGVPGACFWPTWPTFCPHEKCFWVLQKGHFGWDFILRAQWSKTPVPDDAQDMPQMVPQTCPRWCPRHAPDMSQMMPQTCPKWCQDMPQMMPQMIPQTCPRWCSRHTPYKMPSICRLKCSKALVWDGNLSK